MGNHFLRNGFRLAFTAAPGRRSWRMHGNTLAIYSLSQILRSHTIWTKHDNGNISALLAICAGNSPVIGEFPPQKPVTRSFDVFFDLNKQLCNQWWGWWFETPSHPLWRHCNEFACSLWKLTATVLCRSLSNFKAIPSCWRLISQLWDFTKSYDFTSHHLVNKRLGMIQIKYNAWWYVVICLQRTLEEHNTEFRETH